MAKRKHSSNLSQEPKKRLLGSNEDKPKKARSPQYSQPLKIGKSKPKTEAKKEKTTGATAPRRRKLDPLREQLAVLVDEANARVRDIEIMNDHGIQVTSRAIQEAIRTLPKSRLEKDSTLFRSDLPRTRDINRELARVQTFLADYTSFARGAENFTNQMATGLFGAQYRKDGGGGFDSSRVSAEDAELVFDVYHRVIEMGGGYDRVIGYFRANSNGLIEYGSQQLINAIYDMVKNIPLHEMEFADAKERKEAYEDRRDLLISRAYEVVESMIKSYEAIATLQRSGEDYGKLRNDPDYFARFNHWHWMMQRNEYRGNN